MIRNLYIDNKDNSKLDFWLDGKRVTQMYLDGVCVWDVSNPVTIVTGYLINADHSITIDGLTRYFQTVPMPAFDAEGNTTGFTPTPMSSYFYPNKDPNKIDIIGTIDWGDGQKDTYHSGYDSDGSYTYAKHTYSAEYVSKHTDDNGVYITIKIYCDVPYISNYAFLHDESYNPTLYLKSISVADSVQYFYPSLFSTSSKLNNVVQQVKFGEKMSWLQSFTSYGNFEDIDIPDTVEAVGLSSLYYPIKPYDLAYQSYYNIYKGVFSNCERLKTATISDKVKCIGASAFKDCTALGTVNLPLALECIGSYAFINCKKMIMPELPSGLKYIHEYAFGDVSKDLVSYDATIDTSTNDWCLDAPKDTYTTWVTQYGEPQYRVYTIPNNVEYIGDYAFDGYFALTVSLPKNIVLSYSSLAGIGRLEYNSVVYRGTVADWFDCVSFVNGESSSTDLTYANFYANCKVSAKDFYSHWHISRVICDNGIIINPCSIGEFKDGTTYKGNPNAFDSDGNALKDQFLII